MSESPTPTPARFRIRWGWFVACIVLGLTAILLGMLVAPSAALPSYLAGVLANVGTTLLLVGIVVLLERRIIDNAVRVVRRANEQANEALRAQIQDLDDRIAAEWENATAENIAEKTAETKRLADEFTKRVVDETTRGESSAN
jgi:c-di-AMP phosphodiesterase-like protein